MSLDQRIDNFFKGRSQSEKNLLYLTVLLVVAWLLYEYLATPSERFMKREKRKKEKIAAKLKEDKTFLERMKVKGDQEYYIKFYRKKIEGQKARYAQVVEKKNYLEKKIKELSYLLYNKQKWAEFLNSLTHKASQNRVKIDFIENTFLDVTKNFGHVLEVEIGCEGDFKNLIAYLNDIEQSDLVVDIYALQMVGAKPTKLTFKVSVWGINL
ncbi:MAG: hypothetical protein GXO19_02190 [Epsilonproteobacteria bacterium]|nr:hypothetical protein [Campylobacterota bacterium]NPA56527.1 hypothetical protein [Campylobacterota bacterium]